ncbi:hypothetical protein [Escherichia coli]|uniref:hypothetical protein n=1 Tax=Escherichia coli TaxID=562 RepID=UPI001020C120|nr:hypothetical protein [Escherichia coli]
MSNVASLSQYRWRKESKQLEDALGWVLMKQMSHRFIWYEGDKTPWLMIKTDDKPLRESHKFRQWCELDNKEVQWLTERGVPVFFAGMMVPGDTEIFNISVD